MMSKRLLFKLANLRLNCHNPHKKLGRTQASYTPALQGMVLGSSQVFADCQPSFRLSEQGVLL